MLGSGFLLKLPPAAHTGVAGAARQRRESRRHRAGLAAALLLLVVGVPPAAALADEPAEPVLSARLLAPIPGGSTIAIEALDDSDQNLKLRDRIAAALTAQQRVVAADGTLMLRFATEIVADARRSPGGARPPRATRGSGRPLRDFNTDVGGPGDRTRSGRPSGVRYRLHATLEQRDGVVLWQGEAIGVLVGNNEAALWSGLADRVGAAFGRTTDSRVPAPGP